MVEYQISAPANTKTSPEGMSMWYHAAANSIVLLHLAFIFFVVFGGLIAARWKWAACLHIPAAAWGALIEFMGWACPLTPLENAFRDAAGTQGYAEGFIEHYLIPVIYPTGLTNNLQVLLGCIVVAVNSVIYVTLVLRWSTKRSAGAGKIKAATDFSRR